MLKHKRSAHPYVRTRIVPNCKKKDNEAKKVNRILCTFCGQSLRLDCIKVKLLQFLYQKSLFIHLISEPHPQIPFCSENF